MTDHHAGHSEMAHAKPREGHSSQRSYLQFGIELVVDFAIMYIAMFAMIASLSHFLPNLNTLYMTLLMVCPMSIVMLLSMRAMFPSTRLNAGIVVTAAVLFFASLWGIRSQVFVDDAELVRSMIPHHSGAILMCEKASLRDPEVIELCRGIIEGQQREIGQMQAILTRL